MDKKTKKVKAWAVMQDLHTGEYKDIDYLCGYPRIYIQRTKPIVRHNGKDLVVAPCTINYTLPSSNKK